MLKSLNLSILILAIILGTTLASVPRVDQLLDGFAVNANSYSGSFSIKMENHRENFGDKLPAYVPQKHYFSVDCRWDGQRMRLVEETRLTYESEEVNSRQRIKYDSKLYDLSDRIQYSIQDHVPDRAHVTYYAGSLAKEAVFKEAFTRLGAWPWGYFANEKGNRIDEFLRWSLTANVRQKTELINNSECYVLDAETQSAKYTIWFDPNCGYHFAKLIYETPDGIISISNKSFKRYANSWIPTEINLKAYHKKPGKPDEYFLQQRALITEFEVNPDHEMRKSFALNDIPEGTRAAFVSRSGFELPGELLTELRGDTA